VANDDYVHVAMPKLYGAPAYARPPVEPVTRTERPLNPDDLPIESERTDDERAMLSSVDCDGDADMQAGALVAANDGAGRRSFGIRAIAGVFRSDKGSTTDAG
jgi:hypothetical protein